MSKQLQPLIIKDLKALFKQKAMIITLLLPMVMIAGLGILPTMLSQNTQATVVFYTTDEVYTVDTNTTLNLGSIIQQNLISYAVRDQSLTIQLADSLQEFQDAKNGIWIPNNFTQLAYVNRTVVYFERINDADFTITNIMNEIIPRIISETVTHQIVQTQIPVVSANRYFTPAELATGEESKERGRVVFPLAYMVFLILLFGSSSMRIIGFSAEKESNMMELILASVNKRSDLILTKLIVGIIFGIASTMSYILGILFSLLYSKNATAASESNFLIFPANFLTIGNILALALLFIALSLTSMLLALYFQLAYGRESGDRVAYFLHTILTFVFYFAALGNPTESSPINLINPYFWPYKIIVDLIFWENFSEIGIFITAYIALTWWLFTRSTREIEKEKVIFN